ncbi:MAG: GIY-YIG nuclease family protein [Alphaproteobacteria bacterium]|nr:GIY-YIG nuclease family protein [Alphaproteobacteria bacterium]
MSDHFNKTGYVYILASQTAGTLYIGVTSDLVTRVAQHKDGTYRGFTFKYDVDRLVYYEACGAMEHAILREKELKKWRRLWKIQLIEKTNPTWDDLYSRLMRGEFGADSIRI